MYLFINLMETDLPIKIDFTRQKPANVKLTVNRLTQLDILRGVAIIVVFVFHFTGTLYGWESYDKWDGLWRVFDDKPFAHFIYPLTLGWAGVSLFFVISGLVIHLAFLKVDQFNFRHFYWRRFWKIYPAYLVALLFFCWYTHVDVFSRAGALQLLSHILLVHNFHSETFFGINGSFWSLATEIQFYVLYPFLLLIRRKIGIQKTLFYVLLLSVISRIVVMYWTDHTYVISAEWTFPSILWFDWVLGAYVAERFYQGKKAFTLSRRLSLGIGALFVLSTLFKPTYAFSFSFASLLSAILVDRYINRKHNLSRFELAMVPIGLCSYSFYLWHHPLLNTLLYHHTDKALFPNTLPWNMTIVMVGIFSLILAWSWFMYALLEKRSLSLMRRFSALFAPVARKGHWPLPTFYRKNP